MGPLPGNLPAAHIADLAPDLQVLLSWGSTVLSFHSRQSFFVSFFHVNLGLRAPPPPAINLYITCCSDCTTRTLHMPKPAKPSLWKWGRGPQALPVARLTLPLPHPLAWNCRSVWSWPYHCATSTASSSWSVAKFHWYGAWRSAHKSCIHGRRVNKVSFALYFYQSI